MQTWTETFTGGLFYVLKMTSSKSLPWHWRVCVGKEVRATGLTKTMIDAAQHIDLALKQHWNGPK